MTHPDEKLAERVAKEIRQLHKGRGLQAGDLDARLGPLLGELAGTADAAARRQALITELSRYAAQLRGDYRKAIEARRALS
jgi:translation elongation factor EF-Tu-like GTPase